ncbi:MAG: LytR/AlgR family response regulator transcription factor [Bdellovibrionota bacterium]
MNILIVDDEALARSRIAGFLRDHGLQCKVREAENGIEALEALKCAHTDILFLDVQMPGLTGLEVLGQLEKRNFQVIFQTAFDEHAVKAFEENACDYLLKPFTRDRFRKALEKALSHLGHAPDTGVESELLKKNGYLSRILVKAGAKSLLVPVSEILAFVSEDHYTTVITAAREFTIDLSLSHLEERLDPAKFQRLHRNNVVAMDCVRAVIGGDNMEVELSTGRKLPVSRNNRKKLKP